MCFGNLLLLLADNSVRSNRASENLTERITDIDKKLDHVGTGTGNALRRIANWRKTNVRALLALTRWLGYAVETAKVPSYPLSNPSLLPPILGPPLPEQPRSAKKLPP